MKRLFAIRLRVLTSVLAPAGLAFAAACAAPPTASPTDLLPAETVPPTATSTPREPTSTAAELPSPTADKTAAPSATPTKDPLSCLGKIAFFLNNTLYTMNADGSGRTLVRELVELTQGVSWSPDGKRLVHDFGFQIGISAADGSSYYKITGKGDRNISSLEPDWSPDGRWIAYITDKSLREDPNSPFRYADLFLMRTDGTDAWNLSPNQPIHSGAPDWSPEGL